MIVYSFFSSFLIYDLEKKSVTKGTRSIEKIFFPKAHISFKKRKTPLRAQNKLHKLSLTLSLFARAPRARVRVLLCSLRVVVFLLF